MDNVATASIKAFGPSPKADFVPPDDLILEIPLSEFQNILNDLVLTYNQMAQMVKDAGILRGRELARLTEDHSRAVKAEKSPTTKLLLLNAYCKQLLTKIREALKRRPADGRKIIQVASKIQARAIKIVDYIKTLADGKKEVSLDSQQARILFSGAGGETVSRKETIRAMRRAEALWPGLRCSHRPNDGRQTMRLTGKAEELQDSPIIGYRDLWQRSEKRAVLGL